MPPLQPRAGEEPPLPKLRDIPYGKLKSNDYRACDKASDAYNNPKRDYPLRYLLAKYTTWPDEPYDELHAQELLHISMFYRHKINNAKVQSRDLRALVWDYLVKVAAGFMAASAVAGTDMRCIKDTQSCYEFLTIEHQLENELEAERMESRVNNAASERARNSPPWRQRRIPWGVNWEEYEVVPDPVYHSDAES